MHGALKKFVEISFVTIEMFKGGINIISDSFEEMEEEHVES